MLGRVLGDFEIKHRLGAGGGGEVFLAEQLRLGREAVVKVMTAPGDDATNRFLREARLASQLDHPFAAHVYGFGIEPEGLMWIAMEFVRGLSLDAMISQHGPIALPHFVPLFERLCEVLHAAHEQGIVHRDIKPANVMVISRAGRLLPKLLDLGIARRQAEPQPDEHPVEAQAPSSSETVQTLSGSQTLSATIVEQLESSETSQLTRIGAVIGTPNYMAPEQWLNASKVDSRADLYSLAILAYQALTGRTPFLGKSLRQLARAHAQAELPALPETLPRALYEVLSKGAAKSPDARYAQATEFGAALRAASGVGVEPLVLPQLPENVRQSLLAEAPQPIAEAVGLLESARTPRHQLDALVMVRRVVIRHLATVSLAARARVGPGGPSDAPAVMSALRKLATSRLEDDEWLTLACELTRPFAFRKNAHPVPALVSFFFADESDANAGAGISALRDYDALAWPSKEATDDEVHATLLKRLPALAVWLQALGFLYDTCLVVHRDAPERWMGTRKPHRLVQALLTHSPGEDESPFLVDSVGYPVLTLAPLQQVFTPGAGLEPELFYLDGAGLHGARLVALPGPFERQSAEIWPWFSKYIFDVAQAQTAAEATEKAPYKGLSTFTSEDVDYYYGREKEAQTFANRLRLTPLLAVVGPSGSGKSSFILAGVLPLLPKGWRAIVMRPGAAPLQMLASKLQIALQSLSAKSAIEMLVDEERLLIVVDQFEELVTLCPDEVTREKFAQVLVDLAESPTARVRVVLTLRDDFLIRVQQLASLRERLSSSLQLLGTPARVDLLRVVTEPAARLGFGFDDVNLPARMVDEVAAYPGALALLSFTATQLWQLRDRHLRQMRAQTYVALGGVGGALANHAEMTLAQLKEGEAGLVREAFRHLVTAQSTRAVLSRKEMLDVLGNSDAAQTVLEKLIAARLLVTSEDASGDDRVEIIHEALIVAWPRLVSWLRDDAETARLRDALRASAKQWAERARPLGLLWRKETLAEYRIWRTRFSGRLTALEEAFAAASLRDEARVRTVRRALAALVFLTLVVGLVLVFRAYREADASAEEAKQRFADMRVEQARLAALNERPFETLLFGAEARKLGAAGQTLDSLEMRARTKLEGEVAWRYMGEGLKVVSSELGDRLAALGVKGHFWLLSMPSMETLFELRSSGGTELDFAFLGDGHSGILCRDHEILLIADSGRGPRVLTKTASTLRGCALSPSATTLAALELGGRLHLWSLDSRGALSDERIVDVQGDFPLLRFSPQGDLLAGYHGSKALLKSGSIFVFLVDVKTGREVSRLGTEDRAVAIDFSPDGARLAVGVVDGVGRIFSTRDGALVRRLSGHADRVSDIHFSANGDDIITASGDRTIHIWGADGVIKASLAGEAPVNRVDLFATGELLTTTSDGAVHWWSLGLTAPMKTFFGHASDLIGFAHVGQREFVTSASDGALRLWNLDAVLSVRRFEVGENTFALPSNDGKWVLVGPDNGEFTRWQLPSGAPLDRMKIGGCDPNPNMAMTHGEVPLIATSAESDVCLVRFGSASNARRLVGHRQRVRRVEFSADDRFLASSSLDNFVIVWNVESGEPIAKLEHASAPLGIRFSDNGSRLVVACEDGSLHVWSWQRQVELVGWKAHEDRAISASFVEHDTQVLSASKDQQVALWDASSGALIRRFSGHTQTVNSAQISPDGTIIASIDLGGTIILWSVADGWAIDRIRSGGSPSDVRWLSGNRLIAAMGNRPYVFLYRPFSPDAALDWQCLTPWALKSSVIAPRTDWSGCSSWHGRAESE